MKRIIFILLIIVSSLIVFSGLVFASETIDVKDYIKGNFPVIFNIYLAPLGELDEDEKEFIDLLQNLPKEEQKNFASEVYENGFSREILESCRESIIAKEEEFEPEIEEEVINIGKWICNRGIDPIDDTEITTFALYSDSGESVSGKPIRLVLRYQSGKKSGKTRLYINWYDYFNGRYIGSDYFNITPVAYRLGTEKAQTGDWAISNDRETTTYVRPGLLSIYRNPTSKDTIKFIGRLMQFDSFVAKVAPYSENPVTAVFDVRGLKAAVEPYNGILNWVKE
jgi:type VI secretion system protein VasI